MSLVERIGYVLYLMILGWKAFQLVRAPHDRGTLLVTLCLTCGAVLYPFEAILGNTVQAQLAAGPAVLMWIHESVLLLLVYLLICFFLYGALADNRAKRHAAWQAVPLVIGLSIVAVTALILDPHADPFHYPQPVVGTLYVTSDLYSAYGFGTACFWTLRYARIAAARLSRGLRVASIGFGTLTIVKVILITIVVLDTAGTTVPTPLVVAQDILLLPGILIFTIGVNYPGAVMRGKATQVWYRHLRDYHRLRPLWTELHNVFPDDALQRAPISRWKDILTFHGVHRRYYRRAIECRDGLVRLSPYIAEIRGESTDLPTEREVTKALEAHSNGTSAPAQATTVALPDHDGLTADVRELVALSQRLRSTTSVPDTPP